MKNILVVASSLLLSCGSMAGGGNGGAASGGTGGGPSAGGGGGGGAGGIGGTGGVGGGGGVSVTPDWVSGSRLRANVVMSADGAKAFAGNFYDSQLHFNCFFQRAADDTARCLPNDVAIWPNLFSDSGCQNRIAYASFTCATVPTFAVDRVQATCKEVGGYPTPNTVRAYRLTSATPYTGPYWSMTGTPATCTTIATPPLGTSYQYFTVSNTEEPPTSFVSGTIGPE